MLMHISTVPAPHRATRRIRLLGRARPAIVWSIAVFAAFQLGLAFAIEYRLPELRDPNYAIKADRLQRRWTEVRRNAEHAKLVVILGSSRTAFGVKADELEEPLSRDLGGPVVAYNMGVFAAGPVTELVHLKRLIADGIRPDLLLIEVLPPLLAGQHAVPSESNWLPAEKLSFRASRSDVGAIERATTDCTAAPPTSESKRSYTWHASPMLRPPPSGPCTQWSSGM